MNSIRLYGFDVAICVRGYLSVGTGQGSLLVLGSACGPRPWALSVGTGQGSLFCIWAALRFCCGDLARFKLWSACGRQP